MRKSGTRVKGGNRLLEALPEASRNALAGSLETVPLAPKKILHREHEALKYAYFPSTGLLSLTMPAGSRSVEVAIVGNEGMIGLPLVFGIARCPMAALSHAKGEALRVEAAAFRRRVRDDPELAALLGRYAQAFTVVLAQAVVCNKTHRIEQRCARWLLMAQDRLDADEFPITQDHLACTFSVRRPSISQAARNLQQQGLIQYRQGSLAILNRRGLERVACECYSAMRRETSRVFA
jgi:CRP-like cAMP-binding protein